MPRSAETIIGQLQNVATEFSNRQDLKAAFFSLLNELHQVLAVDNRFPESLRGSVDVPNLLVTDRSVWLELISEGHLTQHLFSPDSLLSCPSSDPEIIAAVASGTSPDLEKVVCAYAIHEFEQGDLGLVDLLVSSAPTLLARNASEMHSVWEHEEGFERLVTLIGRGYAPVLQQDPNQSYFLPDTAEAANAFKSVLLSSPQLLVRFVEIGLSLSKSFTQALQDFLIERPTWQRPAIQALKTLAQQARAGNILVSNQQIASAIKVHSKLDAWTTADTIELLRVSANQYLFDLIHPQHVPESFYDSMMYHYPGVFPELSPRIGEREFSQLQRETRLRLYSYWLLDSSRPTWWPKWLSTNSIKHLFIHDVVSLARSSTDLPVIQEAVSLVHAALTVEHTGQKGLRRQFVFPSLDRPEYLLVSALLHYAIDQGLTVAGGVWSSLNTAARSIEFGDLLAFRKLPRISGATKQCISQVLREIGGLLEECAQRYVIGELDAFAARNFETWIENSEFCASANRRLLDGANQLPFTAIAIGSSACLSRQQRFTLLGPLGATIDSKHPAWDAYITALSKLILWDATTDEDLEDQVRAAISHGLPVFQLPLPANIYFDADVLLHLTQYGNGTVGDSYVSALDDDDQQRLLYDTEILTILLSLLSKRVERLTLSSLRNLVTSKARSQAMEDAMKQKNLSFNKKDSGRSL